MSDRPPQIVELTTADLERAAACARRRNRMELRPDGDEGYSHERFGALRSTITALFFNELGAQGEIVVARLLGIAAPLHVDTFRSWPDVPPNWSVKTQLSTSRDMADRLLRLRPRDFHNGYRHVLVERDTALDGHLVLRRAWLDPRRGRASRRPAPLLLLR